MSPLAKLNKAFPGAGFTVNAQGDAQGTVNGRNVTITMLIDGGYLADVDRLVCVSRDCPVWAVRAAMRRA